MTPQMPQTILPSSPRRCRLWIGWSIFIIVLCALWYYSPIFEYCWGDWKQGSLYRQGKYQCYCPAASEEARIPQQADVIVPACNSGSVKISPSGRFLYVAEQNPKTNLSNRYVLDFQSGAKIPINISGYTYFLTDDLLYVSLGILENEYILDRATGDQYQIHEFEFLHPEAYEKRKADLNLLAKELQKAKKVFLVSVDKYYSYDVLALPSDFFDISSQGFVIGADEFPDGVDVKQFLQGNNIIYQITPPNYQKEAVSSDGRFVARPEGIFLVKTGEKIVEGYSVHREFYEQFTEYLTVVGWTFDSTGAIYFGREICSSDVPIIYGIFLEEDNLYYCVPQPTIILKVPEKYLLPQEHPDRH
jgi:hypothetical protein